MSDDNVTPIDVMGGRPKRSTKTGGHKHGERPLVGKRARVAELEAENRELRERLEINEPIDETLWEELTTPDLRDEMAARALIGEWGNAWAALRRLGFKINRSDTDTVRRIADRIFKTPGVQAKLSRNLSKVEENREAILARTQMTALHGDDETSIRATKLLADMTGWVKPPEVNVSIDKRTVNLFSLIGGTARDGQPKVEPPPNVDGDPLAILSHEPGEPVRIDSGNDAIDAVFRESEDD